MAVEIVTVPCLQDNYAFVLHDPVTQETAVVDVPDAAPIKDVLEARVWKITQIWLTHHHFDHVDGLPGLLASHPAQVIGAAADAHRLPPLDIQVAQGDTFSFAGAPVHIIDVSGHTLNHIALHVPAANAVFTADSLMALGCGRLFEGTPAQMWDSLCKLSALPPETIVCSGHEYTQSNARFALTIDPANQALISRAQEIDKLRAQNIATVPSSLQLELATNPFLRATDPAIQAHLNMVGANAADVFTEIRARKDRF